MENRRKWNSQKDSENTSEGSANECDDEDIEWRQAQGTTHNQWNHNISLYLLEEDIETDDTTYRPDTYFRTKEDHEKSWDKSNNRTQIWHKFHRASYECKWKYMIYRQTNQLSNKESNQIYTKHENCEKELSSEPSMDSKWDSTLSTTEVAPEIGGEDSKKPTKKRYSLEYDKECQKYKEEKCGYSRRHTRSKGETNSRKLSERSLDKITNSVDISNKTVHNQLSTISIDDKWTNPLNICFSTNDTTEIKRQPIQHRKIISRLSFKSSDSIGNVDFWIFCQAYKNRNNRDDKETNNQKETQKSDQYSQDIRNFPFAETYHKWSEEQRKETRNEKHSYQISQEIYNPNK